MIKPVDFQVLLPKTPEVSRIQSNEQHKGIAVQQQQVTSLQNIAEKSLRQVYLPDKAYEVKIREKQQERRGAQKENDEEKKEKGKNSTKRKESRRENRKDSIIDIKI